MKQLENILFYIAVNSEYPVQMRLARMLKLQNNFSPVLCIDFISHNLETEVVKAKKERFSIIQIAGKGRGNKPDRFLTRTGLLPDECDHKSSFYLPDLKKIKIASEEKITFFQTVIRKHLIKLVVISINT